MKVKALKCSECGANLSVDANQRQCFCQYCGTRLIVDDGTSMHTYREIDEARIKEAEMNAQIRLKELEIEEKKQMAAQKAKARKVNLAILSGTIGILLMVIGFTAGGASGDPDSPLYFLSMIGMFPLMGVIPICLGGEKK